MERTQESLQEKRMNIIYDYYIIYCNFDKLLYFYIILINLIFFIFSIAGYNTVIRYTVYSYKDIELIIFQKEKI